jgi:hypothetical protein
MTDSNIGNLLWNAGKFKKKKRERKLLESRVVVVVVVVTHTLQIALDMY